MADDITDEDYAIVDRVWKGLRAIPWPPNGCQDPDAWFQATMEKGAIIFNSALYWPAWNRRWDFYYPEHDSMINHWDFGRGRFLECMAGAVEKAKRAYLKIEPRAIRLAQEWREKGKDNPALAVEAVSLLLAFEAIRHLRERKESGDRQLFDTLNAPSTLVQIEKS